MKYLSKEFLSQATTRTLSYLKQLRDVRVLGVHVFVVIALLVTWSGIGVVQTNYQLQKRLSRLEQENELQTLENATLKLRNEYYNTDQYLELTARKQFGLAAPGETLLLVPKSVALAHTVEPPPPSTQEEVRTPSKPTYQRNFEAWMEFFFRKRASRD
jgi:cell division protein FtsB